MVRSAFMLTTLGTVAAVAGRIEESRGDPVACASRSTCIDVSAESLTRACLNILARISPESAEPDFADPDRDPGRAVLGGIFNSLASITIV
jgi:hypothetical protein